jgi:hypothetical protein
VPRGIGWAHLATIGAACPYGLFHQLLREHSHSATKKVVSTERDQIRASGETLYVERDATVTA